MAVRLHIKEGGEERIYEIKSDKIILGRGQENEVCVSDGKCSRRHAQIERTDHGFKLVDLESRNGTRVNEGVVNQRVLLHGDVVRIGDTELVFDDGSGKLPDRSRKAEAAIPKAEPVKEPLVKEVVKEIRMDGAPKVGVPLTPHVDPRPSQMIEGPVVSEGVRRTTEANRLITQRAIDHNRATVSDSASTRAQVQEVRRQQEEQAKLKAFAIGVGVFFTLVILLIVVQSLTGKPTDRRVSEEALSRARARYREAESEPDPRQAIILLKDAMDRIESIPPQVEEVHRAGQDLKRDVIESLKVKEALLHKNEIAELEELVKRGAKPTDSAGIEKLLNDISAFRKRYGQEQKLLVETEQRLAALETQLKAQRGTSKQMDYNSLKERADDALRMNRFTDALAEADQMLRKFETDPILNPKSVAVREDVIKAAGVYVEGQRQKAKELKKSGKPADAKWVYNETIDKLGDGRVDAFRGYVELLRNERDQ
jgi:pSer/pThr/pTyr-binding forkhead associated (FHA) protein